MRLHRLARCRQLLAGGCGTSRTGFVPAKAGGGQSLFLCQAVEQRGRHRAVWSREPGHAALSCAESCPSPSNPLAPRRCCQVSKPFWCSQVTFSSTSLHHKLPACFKDKSSHFQAAVLPQTKAGSCSAGIGIFRDEHTRGVNCWCLQGCFITPLVCTLWKSESRISGSPTSPGDAYG